MKEAIFHPEARAEVRESVEFYEARLDGLGLRFLAAVEATAERISTNPKAGSPLAAELRKRIIQGFPYNIIYRAGRITFTSLQSLTITVVRAIGATGPPVASHRREEPPCAPEPAR